MRYRYRCLEHGDVIRDVPVDDRDMQACDCGADMVRVFEASSNIYIAEKHRAGFDHGNLNASTPEGMQRQAEAVPCGKGSRWV